MKEDSYQYTKYKMQNEKQIQIKCQERRNEKEDALMRMIYIKAATAVSVI